MSESLTDFIKDLELADKLLPQKNPNIAWVWVFFPALLSYFALMMQILNGKPVMGSIEVFSPKFEKLIRPSSPIEVISKGNKFTEGPLWIDNEDGSPFLLYSDVKQNNIFRWEEGKGFFTVGKTLYLGQSGCHQDTGTTEDAATTSSASASASTAPSYCDSLSLPGSNGLIRVFPRSPDSGNVDLVICQHGERSISLQRDNGTRTAIATHYQGKRLNSPNDLAWSKEGHLYFTDPPYGLYKNKFTIEKSIAIPTGERVLDKSLQEQEVSGLYMIHRSEIQTALETGKPAENIFRIKSAKMSNPNGLVFSPGYSKLYVSNSDPDDAYIKVFDVNTNGLAHAGKLFYNVTEMLVKHAIGGKESFGVPDGLKVDISGNIYATGPGGVLIFTPEA